MMFAKARSSTTNRFWLIDLVIVALATDPDLEELHPGYRSGNLVRRIHHLCPSGCDFEKQRGGIADNFHIVNIAIRYLHQKAFRRDERLLAINVEFHLT